jgi:hypothetical protein
VTRRTTSLRTWQRFRCSPGGAAVAQSISSPREAPRARREPTISLAASLITISLLASCSARTVAVTRAIAPPVVSSAPRARAARFDAERHCLEVEAPRWDIAEEQSRAFCADYLRVSLYMPVVRGSHALVYQRTVQPALRSTATKCAEDLALTRSMRSTCRGTRFDALLAPDGVVRWLSRGRYLPECEPFAACLRGRFVNMQTRFNNERDGFTVLSFPPWAWVWWIQDNVPHSDAEIVL